MPDSDPPEPDSMHLYDLLDGFLQVHPQGDEADLEAWASGVPELASDPELVERLGELLYQVEAVLGELMPLEHRPGKVSIFRRRLADAIAGIADVVVSGLVRMLRPGRANGQRIEAVAEPYLREALEKSRRVLGDEHLDTLFSIDNRGNLLANQGKLTEAEPYFREALEIRRRVLGDEHEHTLHSIGNLGTLLMEQGKLTEAEAYLREALEKRRRVLGDEHPDTVASINNLGTLLQDQGKLTEAEPYLREALDIRRRVLGDEHPWTLISIGNLGTLLMEQGKLTEAEAYLREALEKSPRVLGDEDPYTARSLRAQHQLLLDGERPDEARTLLTDFLATSSLPEDHPLRSEVRGLLEAEDGSGGSEEDDGKAKDGD